MQEILKYIRIDPYSSTPISVQLSQQLSWLIASGEIKSSEMLPPASKMAKHLGVHLHTVRSAYQNLKEDNLVEIERGRGTTVLPYSRHALAKQRPDIPSFIIGVFIPDFTPFYIPLLHGIEQITHDSPLQIIVTSTRDDDADRYVDRLLTRGLDGFILVSIGLSPEFEEEIERNMDQPGNLPPMVFVDTPHIQGHTLLLDSESSGLQATQHLIEHGHSQIGIITCPLEWPNVNQVYQGSRRAINEAGLDFIPDHVSIAPVFEIEAGYQAALRLLQVDKSPTAIFAVDDTLAYGAMQAIKEFNLRIPEDVAIVGNTNLQLSGLVDPPLTTVSAPAYEMGACAIDILYKLIRGETLQPKQQIFPTKLVIRESCGCHAND
jgi:LacI family repressor for deo operon, udp, cdd, tsx, nupC, and nupG